MIVQILGAHNCESQNSKHTCLLIDDILAMDAGGLSSSLSPESQQNLKAILLTHYHYDHIRDIPALAMNFFLRGNTITVYSTQVVQEALTNYLLNNKLYPDFSKRPPEKPTVKFTVLQPHKVVQIEGYDILTVPVYHSVPTVGYQVTSPDGKIVFYTGDTGPSLADCWKQVAPQLLIIDVSGADYYQASARENGHLTPALLEQELSSFRTINGYLPEVVTVHMTPHMEKEIESELAGVAHRLDHPIKLAYTGMQIEL
jgi:ribonuclease BN (tRNA processing enzyme)